MNTEAVGMRYDITRDITIWPHPDDMASWLRGGPAFVVRAAASRLDDHETMVMGTAESVRHGGY